jgi:very-short-patch-repair endonuclease
MNTNKDSKKLLLNELNNLNLNPKSDFKIGGKIVDIALPKEKTVIKINKNNEHSDSLKYFLKDRKWKLIYANNEKILKNSKSEAKKIYNKVHKQESFHQRVESIKVTFKRNTRRNTISMIISIIILIFIIIIFFSIISFLLPFILIGLAVYFGIKLANSK